MHSDDALIFERSVTGRRCSAPPRLPDEVWAAFAAKRGGADELASEGGTDPAGRARCERLIGSRARKTPPPLPEVSELDLVRRYTNLARKSHGVDNGFYPLGSCTMKYNPKSNELCAALPGFTRAHPLADEESVQGCLALIRKLTDCLRDVTGMDDVSLQPAAGAHGEFTSLLMIKAYYEHAGDTKRRKVIVPDSAHGTNPAAASMCGFLVRTIPSGKDGLVDLDALRRECDDETAALMLTNPNTLGLFEKNIKEIADIAHGCGALLYYDGANLNAVMGKCRPGDMGFDVVHLNLHKTFSTPHGGGGPGSGPVGCKSALADFLPGARVVKEEGRFVSRRRARSIGDVRSFYGNFLVYVKAYAYILSLGGDGLREASENATLNANYLLSLLAPEYESPFGPSCMHEFVLSLENLKAATGVTAADAAKSLMDSGIHPPTMYFPLIVREALMIEPTETESKETLEHAAKALKAAYAAAFTDPALLKNAPTTTPIRRADELAAARKPKLRFIMTEENS